LRLILFEIHGEAGGTSGSDNIGAVIKNDDRMGHVFHLTDGINRSVITSPERI
jgi:hypothetical protein